MNRRHLILLILSISSLYKGIAIENPEIPFTGEEAPQKITVLSEEDFVQIINPKFVSPRSAKSPEESEKIRRENEIWQQYQKDLERYQKIKNLPKDFPEEKIRDKPKSFFYKYTVTQDKEKYLDTFNGIYARFQTGQGTLATINRLSCPEDLKTGMSLIFPVMQGIFIPEKVSSALEIIIQKEYAKEITRQTEIFEIDGKRFYFLPSKTFSQTQKAFFHDNGMQLPLSKKIVTSEFGYRTSPISGKWKFHAGIDLAAPIGTEVFACKSGEVTTVGYNEIYGNYVVLLHSANRTSLYAHLSKALVKQGQRVSTGETIALTGTTGASTGPHLHFEVREDGKATDPTRQIKNF
ncbi:M23 family metallopeptidase [uncultured Treponema sp.]|uniref:LysM peptidoglycan-binding domain-containing M23 family metallopeptidase n=1 Tax=uncultured Treponema sp. TaxID=162155 RepID=UPI0025D3C015|nr:M23 family metallopeptidase [uncultured Treponema sp.]